MVMAGVLVNEKDRSKLVKLGVKDSKLLTGKQRNTLFDKIIKIIKKYKIIIVSPQEIDEALNSDDSNLNWLEAQTSARIINELKPKKAIVDSPSNNCAAYKNYLKNIVYSGTELIVEHKADLNHIEVAAASILAKVTRDNEIEKLKKKYGDFGPGYMSNQITQKFLEENWEKYPEIFRQSWVSYKNHKNMKHQKKLGDY